MKYYLVAGEASGDLHGSNLMRGLYARDPEADMRFWGGGLMDAVYKEHQSGTGLVKDYREGAIMGIWEVLVQARKLLGRVRSCEEDIAAWTSLNEWKAGIPEAFIDRKSTRLNSSHP